jgi:PAS domain S-box-containing protein
MTSQHVERQLTSARALAAISELHSTTPSDRNVSVVLEAILDQAFSALGAQIAYVRLVSLDRTGLTLAAERNLPKDSALRQTEVALGAESPEARAVREKTVLVIDMDDAASTRASRELLERTGYPCMVYVPLETAGELVGVLCYAQKHAHHFSVSETEALRAMASAFAAGLQSSLRLRHLLSERVKELKTLRGATRTLRGTADNDRDPLRTVVESLPAGWQYPEISAGRIRVGDIEVTTEGFAETEWMQSAHFTTRSGTHGRIDVVYLAPRPPESEGPFLAEERELIDSLAELLCAYFERRGAENGYRTSVERLRVALKNAPVSVSHQDRELRYVWTYNEPRSWAEVHRLGKTDCDYLPPIDAERLTRFKAEVLRTGVGTRVEVRQTILGKEYFYDLTIEPLRDSTGKVVGITSAAVDITERTEFERARERLLEQLDTERKRLEAVLDQMPGAVVLTDARGQIMLQNRAALTFSATNTRHIKTLTGFDIRLPSGEAHAPETLPLAKAIRDGTTTQSIELLIRRADGDLIPVLASAAPIRGPSGEFVGAVAVFQDIIRLKHLERLREEWTSIIAHDLRQPITTIMMSAALLERQTGECSCTSDQRTLQYIVRSAKKIERMTTDLMDVSLIESKRLALDMKEIDLRVLVSEVLDWMAAQLQGHLLRVEVRGLVQPVHADRGRIEQVLTNLLSNAAKYGDPDTPIDVAIETLEDELAVSVTNCGKGLEPDELGSIFARFRRGRAAAGATGVGLGLYISKGLVAAHGGRMWAESTPGKTTTFHFTLPTRRLSNSVIASQPETRS